MIAFHIGRFLPSDIFLKGKLHMLTITYEVGSGLYLNITNRCPCNCSFCIRNNGDTAYGSDSLWLEREPEYDEIIANLEKRDLQHYSEIVFCGFGEPTERLALLLDICRWLKQHNSPPVRLNTNGLADLINKEKTAQKFVGLVDKISVSLNTSSEKKYEELCRPAFGIESYHALLRFAAECGKLGIDTVLSVVDVIGRDEIALCRSIAESIGVPLRVRKLD